MLIDLSTVTIIDLAIRHFPSATSNNTFAGTKITKYPGEHIADQVKAFLEEMREHDPTVLDSFAPFCKALVFDNFTGCMGGMARITDDNRDKLKGEWKVRNEGEAEYWSVWLDAADVEPETARYLHVIVYSREQLEKEGYPLPEGAEWGIVSINAEQVAYAVPMAPETMRRNCAGIEAGGNGHQHTEAEIAEAEEYHSQWACVG